MLTLASGGDILGQRPAVRRRPEELLLEDGIGRGPDVSAGVAVPSPLRLQVRGVSKSFPGVRALSDVDLDVAPGELHALIGENGAGKSTLMHLIAGVFPLDSGEITLDGAAYLPADEAAAQLAGVAMVYQERSLTPELSVAENVFAGRQPTRRFGIIDEGAMKRRTRELLAELETGIPAETRVGLLSPGQQQMVEIAKALSMDLRLLILDEPTSSLTISEARHLFRVLRTLSARGVGIVYVTHRLVEVFEVASRVTVLRDGRVTGVRRIDETTPAELIQLQVGRELSFEPDSRRVAEDAPIVLEVEDLAAPPVSSVSLRVRAGEIVCLAGLVGAGRTETCEAIFGLRPRLSGRINVDGHVIHPRHAMDAMNAGIGMVPEDRKDAGLFLAMSVAANIAAASLDAVTQAGVISDRLIKERAEEFVKQLRIATPSIDREVRLLSGGNQQKVLLAKWLARKPRVLIVDEPTRGVDVGSKADVYAILRELAASGTALLVVSSDLPEVLALAHRIIVMSEGRVAGELDAAGADEVRILQLAAPGSGSARAAA
jgi:ribose transport system ATP-binding protein/rhamnose transport system ATP-binding protein